jgi:hypothetical protein
MPAAGTPVAGEVPPLSIPGLGGESDEGGFVGPLPRGKAGQGLKDALDLFMPPGTGAKKEDDTSGETPEPPPDGKTDGSAR